MAATSALDFHGVHGTSFVEILTVCGTSHHTRARVLAFLLYIR